jgi:hypothetical protein
MMLIPSIWFSFVAFVVATMCNGFLSVNLEPKVRALHCTVGYHLQWKQYQTMLLLSQFLAQGWCPPHSRIYVDPDLNPNSDPPDPHVFGPPGSGSTTQRYGSGSGSLYNHAKIVRKTLIPTIFLLF